MHDLRAISALFQMRADFTESHAFGSGHINDTYCASYNQAGTPIRYIHQRVNSQVFQNPIAVMENVDLVTRHSLATLLAARDPEAHRRTLTCIPALDGKPYAIDKDGNFWRTYLFIEGADARDEIENNEQAYQAARAFGDFQKLCANLPAERLHETIPDFHHTPKRLEALEIAIEKNLVGRASSVTTEIAFVRQRSGDCSRIVDLIESGEIPQRITHNDTKISNVLLDKVSGASICVLDLDTTMPGSALYDFGDLVRTAASSASEDAIDLTHIEIRLDRFEALVKGYLSTATFLNNVELSLLAFSGKLITFECGMRFLTDYLNGDIYFKIHRPQHNLDRCRNQFAFVSALEKSILSMEEIVRKNSNLK